jgi:predicted MFS family arabinose efflux permease
LGAALYFTNNIALVIDLFDPSIRGKALGNLHGIEMIGSLIGQPAGAFIADVIGFQNVFYLSAVSIAVSFLFAWTSREFKDADTHRVQRGTSLLDSLRGVKSRGLFLVSLVRMLRMIITMSVIMTAFPLFLTDHFALTVTLIGLVMTTRTVAFMIATFSGGHVIDRIGTKSAAVIGILIEATTLLLYPLIPEASIVFVLVFVGGFGSGLFQIALALLMSLQMEERFIGSGVGIYRTFQDAGSVVGPILVMLIAEAVGIRSTFIVGLGAYLLSIPLILLTKKAK